MLSYHALQPQELKWVRVPPSNIDGPRILLGKKLKLKPVQYMCMEEMNP